MSDGKAQRPAARRWPLAGGMAWSRRLLWLFLALGGFAGAAGSAGPALAAAEALPEPASAPSGAETYKSYCARCHGLDGDGQGGDFPPLDASARSWEDRHLVLRRVLGGCASQGSVAKALGRPCMPAHGFLGNETLAAALNHVVSLWGQPGPHFTAEQVASVRRELLDTHHGQPEDWPGVSPLEELDAAQVVTGSGPPMSVDEFDRARRLYYGYCTGCHGVLREGAAGSPLTPELMSRLGTEYLRRVISFGSGLGMPGWGTSETLDGRDIDLLARFLQHPVPQPPDLDLAGIRETWSLLRPPADRPEARQHGYAIDDLFAVLLHDVARVLLVHGPSREVVAQIDTGRGPHLARLSESGRYLYVIARDGTVTGVDLYADPPAAVASVRIGFEARALGVSQHPDYADRYLLAGAFWPPHLVLLDGATLEPLRVVGTRSRDLRTGRYHPEARVADVAGSRRRPEFIAQIQETGHTWLFPYDDVDALRIVDLEASPELRAGSFDASGRYYLTPADSQAVSVVDTERQSVVAEIPARLFGASRGTSYVHPRLGPLWVTATMVDDRLTAFGVDPERHGELAWQILFEAATPGVGTLTLASHPNSPRLWLDTPLNRDPELSRAVAVYDRNDPEAGFRTLPVAQWSGVVPDDVLPERVPGRVLMPTYDVDGKEVWLVVWNPQEQRSALVIVDDATLELKDVIDDNRLITPIRLYNLGNLARHH